MARIRTPDSGTASIISAKKESLSKTTKAKIIIKAVKNCITLKKTSYSKMYQETHNLNTIRPRKQQSVVNTVFSSWGNNNYEEKTYGKNEDFKSKQYAKEILMSKKTPPKGSTENKFESSLNHFKGKMELTNFKSISSNLRFYLQKSTLHGMRYIGDGSLSLLER